MLVCRNTKCRTGLSAVCVIFLLVLTCSAVSTGVSLEEAEKLYGNPKPTAPTVTSPPPNGASPDPSNEAYYGQAIKNYGTSVKELITAGLITTPLGISYRHRSVIHKATILETGEIQDVIFVLCLITHIFVVYWASFCHTHLLDTIH